MYATDEQHYGLDESFCLPPTHLWHMVECVEDGLFSWVIILAQ